jgi:hypothetical protein
MGLSRPQTEFGNKGKLQFFTEISLKPILFGRHSRVFLAGIQMGG